MSNMFLILLIAAIFPTILIVAIVKAIKRNPKEAKNRNEVCVMKYCSNCGAEVNENAVVCIKCGCALSPRFSYEDDIPSTGLNILSFIFPLIGLILYIVFSSKTPMKAKAIGKWAIISVVLSISFSLLSILVLAFS